MLMLCPPPRTTADRRGGCAPADPNPCTRLRAKSISAPRRSAAQSSLSAPTAARGRSVALFPFPAPAHRDSTARCAPRLGAPAHCGMPFEELEAEAHRNVWSKLVDLHHATDTRFPEHQATLGATRTALLDLCTTVRTHAERVWSRNRASAMRYDRACSYQVALVSDLTNLLEYIHGVQDPAHLRASHVVRMLPQPLWAPWRYIFSPSIGQFLINYCCTGTALLDYCLCLATECSSAPSRTILHPYARQRPACRSAYPDRAPGSELEAQTNIRMQRESVDVLLPLFLWLKLTQSP